MTSARLMALPFRNETFAKHLPLGICVFPFTKINIVKSLSVRATVPFFTNKIQQCSYPSKNTSFFLLEANQIVQTLKPSKSCNSLVAEKSLVLCVVIYIIFAVLKTLNFTFANLPNKNLQYSGLVVKRSLCFEI